jgi:hypothetical protein
VPRRTRNRGRLWGLLLGSPTVGSLEAPAEVGLITAFLFDTITLIALKQDESHHFFLIHPH